MSEPVTFASLFVNVCRTKRMAGATDILVADENALPGGVLAIYGSDGQTLTFSDQGLSFKSPEGETVEFTWQELDFILPGDLTLSNDKLYTFSDMNLLAGQIAHVTGRVLAIAAVVGLAFVVMSTIYGVLAPIAIALHTYLGTFGDVLSLLGIVMLVIVTSPFLVPIALGALAAGGLVAILGNAVGKQVQPLARWGLSLAFRNFHNGLYVIKSRWVKLPWGTPTPQLLDMILLGVKLRRRGIT